MKASNYPIVIFQAQDISKVRLPNGEIRIAKVSGKFRNKVSELTGYPVVGDYVEGVVSDDIYIISNIVDRRSFLQRKSAGTKLVEQGIAANVDQVFIVSSLNEDLNLSRIDRYVTIVWNSGAIPIILLTKKDLVIEEKLFDILNNIRKRFVGIELICISYLEEVPEKLISMFKSGTISAFIGSSGVGKTSLLNRIQTEQELLVNEVRKRDGKGKHTTTNRQLIVLENNAMIIDTPGMREIGLTPDNQSSIERQFEELNILSQSCKFNNCSHQKEPGCNVKAAIKEGKLTGDILKSYNKMLKEIDYLKMSEQYKQIRNKNKKK